MATWRIVIADLVSGCRSIVSVLRPLCLPVGIVSVSWLVGISTVLNLTVFLIMSLFIPPTRAIAGIMVVALTGAVGSVPLPFGWRSVVGRISRIAVWVFIAFIEE